MSWLSKETYSKYLQCLKNELKKELESNGLKVITQLELAAINKTDPILNKVTLYKDDLLVDRKDRKVIIRLTSNSNALIGITCLSETKNITSQFIICDDDDEDCKRAAEDMFSKHKSRAYGINRNIILRMTDTLYEFGDILDTVGQIIAAITEECHLQNAGGKKRKSKSRKAKPRKAKPRKSKSRKYKPRKAKSRKNN